MKKRELMEVLKRIEEARDFVLDPNCLQSFFTQITDVKLFLSRFGELDRLLAHLELIEDRIFLLKEYFTIEEAAAYLNLSKSHLYKLTASRVFTIYKPSGKTIFISRDELNAWIRSGRSGLCSDRLAKSADPVELQKTSYGLRLIENTNDGKR